MTKPHLTRTRHLLPFAELSAEQFERLCLWLVQREGYLRTAHLGDGGSDQGRDVIGYRASGSDEQLWYFQCKRYQTINAATLIQEVEKYNKLIVAEPSAKPFGIVFVTNARATAGARKKVETFCSGYGYECEFWARTELDSLVKKHKDIVAEFFKRSPAKKETSISTKASSTIIIQGDVHGDVTAATSTGDNNPSVMGSATATLPRDKISVARLLTSGPDLFGRDAELKLLDEAWENPNANIVTFVAWGGVGKTALINHWLKQSMARDNFRSAERVYGWSFYSQGTSERVASADLFVDQALRWFGDADPNQGSPWDKGERLANFIRKARTLLILDGLEPLQYPPGPQEGRLKDAALQALLVELAAQQEGLCVISTREQVSDLVEFETGTVVQHDLEHLSPQAGAQLLRALQVKGDDEELEQAASEYGGHALALTLLGSYVADVFDGDIRRRNEIESLEEDVRHGHHAERIMRAYENWLGEGVELSVLRLLGLFDRPADFGSLLALRAAPAILGLTESLQGLKGSEWQQAVAKLRRIKLLGTASPNDPNTLDGHPLLREHFKQQLKRERSDAWREGNKRLYEYLARTTKEFPDTVNEMSPLHAAVSHGCAAGNHQEAFLQVYWRRIQRGNQHFSREKLGAFGADLALLFGFFEKPWEQPVADLDETLSSFVLAIAGFDLRALGRLQEASEPMQLALQATIKKEDWKNAAISASNLSQLYLTIGDLPQALTLAQRSVELADRSNQEFHRISKRVTLADSLHQAGQILEAAAAFRSAEELQKEFQPAYPFLYSVQGFQYCDLLFSQEKVENLKERAGQVLETAKRGGVLLDIALSTLSLGRAWLLEARQRDSVAITQAVELLQLSVDQLRQSEETIFILRGLLARAEVYRFTGNYARAERDLGEALRIATRGGMNLYLADYHLESARLLLAEGSKDSAREHWMTAKEMIERMGYHRRDNEVSELEQQLS